LKDRRLEVNLELRPRTIRLVDHPKGLIYQFCLVCLINSTLLNM
jgi:hypothetical protein